MQLESLTRVFRFGETELVDLDPSLDVETIREYYAEQFPELTNGSVDGPEVSEDGKKALFTFLTVTGKNG